jgi:segregation and condensation protein B
MLKKKIVEAAIFLSQEPVTIKELSEKLSINADEIKKTLEELKEDYRDRGIQLTEIGEGFRFQTSKEIWNYVRPFVENRPVKLSKNLLEVLAIIAYNQPITKGRLSEIRGKNSNGALKSLIEKGLVKEAGRAKLPGRPKLYRTTREFLIHFGLNSLSDLPQIEVADGKNNSGSGSDRTSL